MLFYRNPGIVPYYILNILAVFHFFLLLSYFLLPGSAFKPFLLTYIFLLLTSFFLCFSLFLRLFFSHYFFEEILFLLPSLYLSLYHISQSVSVFKLFFNFLFATLALPNSYGLPSGCIYCTPSRLVLKLASLTNFIT